MDRARGGELGGRCGQGGGFRDRHARRCRLLRVARGGSGYARRGSRLQRRSRCRRCRDQGHWRRGSGSGRRRRRRHGRRQELVHDRVLQLELERGWLLHGGRCRGGTRDGPRLIGRQEQLWVHEMKVRLFGVPGRRNRRLGLRRCRYRRRDRRGLPGRRGHIQRLLERQVRQEFQRRARRGFHTDISKQRDGGAASRWLTDRKAPPRVRDAGHTWPASTGAAFRRIDASGSITKALIARSSLSCAHVAMARTGVSGKSS